ncbi:MAG: response regulator receiver protein [Atopobiaceae bacterium]|nr:response regulator receiver protein [Atopobiaceae bacterium]
MAFDPQREDYQRLGIRFAQSLHKSDARNAARTFATFGRRFAQDRDSLPQTDSDRAFHLVVLATRAIDYELPFATDLKAAQIIEDGHRMLDEAIALDPHCYDAIRMKAAATNPSFDAFLGFLNERQEEVRAWCEGERARIPLDEPDERYRLLADLAMRPYVRWVAAQAEEALICGRNKEALRLSHMLLELDPHDVADVRFTAAYAYAKLEDQQGLEALVSSNHAAGRLRPPDDAWTQLARLAIHFKRHDPSAAEAVLDALLASYPHAAEALIRQNELPDGVFSRLAVIPYSEDEIILAISEGMVLLQEGVEPQGHGVLGEWVSGMAAKRRPQALLAVLAQQSQQNDSGEDR